MEVLVFPEAREHRSVRRIYQGFPSLTKCGYVQASGKIVWVSISSSIKERRKELAKQTDTSKDPFLERIAHLIARWGLVTPAIAFLEANKPLSFVGSQALLMFQPITDLIVARELSMELAMLLADRERVELLLARLETVKMEHKELG